MSNRQMSNRQIGEGRLKALEAWEELNAVPDPSATLECLAESGLSHDEEIRRAAVELAIELFAASGSAGIKKTAVEINFYLRTGNWSLTDDSPNP